MKLNIYLFNERRLIIRKIHKNLGNVKNSLIKEFDSEPI